MSTRYYIDSFAYDYNMFLPKKGNQNNNVIEINRKNAHSNTISKAKPKTKSITMSTVITVALIVMALALIVTSIFMRVQITEITAQINSVETQIERSLAKNVDLEMQLENSISIDKLEQEAKALGMQKAENYQINYIKVTNEDCITDGK